MASVGHMRILIIARHYPPLVSGGARRPFLLVEGLKRLGHDVKVVAPALPTPDDGVIVSHPNPEPSAGPTVPAKTSAFRNGLRRALLWPDADIRWANRALVASRALASETPFDAVITTSPPESVHRVGFALQRTHGLPWIADFRDNWLDHPLDPVRTRRLRRFGERMIARRWLSRASLLCAPIEPILAEIRRFAPDRPAALMEQACEPLPPSGTTDASISRIAHIGSFSLSDPQRRIGPTLDAFAEASEQAPQLHLDLVGRLTSEEAAAALERLGDRVAIHSTMSREAALAVASKSAGLLLVTAPETGAVPGKLSEYRALQKPVVVVGGGDWLATSGLIAGNPVDDLVDIALRRSAKPPLPPPPTPAASATTLMNALSDALKPGALG